VPQQQASVPDAFDIRPTHGSLVDEIGSRRHRARVTPAVERHRAGRLGVLAKPSDDRQVHVRDELARLAGHGRAGGNARRDQHVAPGRQKDVV